MTEHVPEKTAVPTTAPLSSATTAEPSKIEESAKLKLMDAVQNLIAGHRIARAKVWNPYEALTKDGVDVRTIKAVPGSLTQPAPIPDTIASLASLGLVERRMFGLEKADVGQTVTTMSEGDFQAEREKRRRAYVRWGKGETATFLSGNCSYFAAVTVGLLASENGLQVLPRDAVVELFGFSSSDGHAFLVVNREDGVLSQPTTWGPDAFVIDQWFARQRRGEPGSFAVKDVTGGTDDKYFDPFFNTFISTTMRGPTKFTYDLLADPRDPV